MDRRGSSVDQLADNEDENSDSDEIMSNSLANAIQGETTFANSLFNVNHTTSSSRQGLFARFLRGRLGPSCRHIIEIPAVHPPHRPPSSSTIASSPVDPAPPTSSVSPLSASYQRHRNFQLLEERHLEEQRQLQQFLDNQELETGSGTAMCLLHQNENGHPSHDAPDQLYQQHRQEHRNHQLQLMQQQHHAEYERFLQRRVQNTDQTQAAAPSSTSPSAPMRRPTPRPGFETRATSSAVDRSVNSSGLHTANNNGLNGINQLVSTPMPVIPGRGDMEIVPNHPLFAAWRRHLSATRLLEDIRAAALRRQHQHLLDDQQLQGNIPAPRAPTQAPPVLPLRRDVVSIPRPPLVWSPALTPQPLPHSVGSPSTTLTPQPLPHSVGSPSTTVSRAVLPFTQTAPTSISLAAATPTPTTTTTAATTTTTAATATLASTSSTPTTEITATRTTSATTTMSESLPSTAITASASAPSLLSTSAATTHRADGSNHTKEHVDSSSESSASSDADDSDDSDRELPQNSARTF